MFKYVIEVTELTKKIDNSLILNNINLKLESGGIYGFYGPNGSGKSMLFRALTGLIYPTTGEIYIEGMKLGTDISFPESLGVIIENVGFWEEYTGFENLKILADIKSIASDEDIKNSMSRVGLDPNLKKNYGKYSLGMKQRLAIAQAIMEKPRIIILDEPTNTMDYEGVLEIRKLLKDEQKRGATVLLSSHNPLDLEELCDRFFKFKGNGILEETEGIKRGK